MYSITFKSLLYLCAFYPVSSGMSWSASAAEDSTSTSASALLSLPGADRPHGDSGLTLSPLHHTQTKNPHAPYYLSLLFEHWQCLCGLSVPLSDVTLFNLYVTCVCTVLLTWFASPVAGWSAPAPPASSSKRRSPSASRAAPSGDGNCSPPESHKMPGWGSVVVVGREGSEETTVRGVSQKKKKSGPVHYLMMSAIGDKKK